MVKARNRIILSVNSNKSKKSKDIRKYEVAYHKCIKICTKSKQCNKSIRKLKLKPKKRSIKRSCRKRQIRSPKRSLNPYQKFVRKESSKSIYRGKDIKSRMQAISKLWKRSRN